MSYVRKATACLLLIPAAASAQYYGLSCGSLKSTVDWQFSPPPPQCGDCIVDASPAGSREAFAPAIVWQGRAHEWVGFASEVRYSPKGFAITQSVLVHLEWMREAKPATRL